MKLTLELIPADKQRRARRVPRAEQIVAYEFRSPRSWCVDGPLGIFTVITSDRQVALEAVYTLGYTTGDIACGHIDLVPISRKERQRMAKAL